MSTAAIEQTPYMNVEDAARYLCLSVSTLYKWASADKIPHRKLNGKLLFHREDIDAWARPAAAKPPRPASISKFQEVRQRLRSSSLKTEDTAFLPPAPRKGVG